MDEARTPRATVTGSADPVAVRMRATAAICLVLASMVTLGGFGWPFVFAPGDAADATSHATDAPWLFVIVLPLLAAIVLSELNAGLIDAKAIALLGMLSAVGGALRALSPGVAGLEPSFAVIVLGGRVFGRGFGFVLGALTIFVGAVITGGVGPWLPFQMMAAGWVGFLAGCLPRWRGPAELALLGTFGAVIGLGYGAMMNLWFWPFGVFGENQSFVPGASVPANLANYARYYVITSLIWDVGRAAGTMLLLLLTGRPLLRALRRASRRAAFEPEVRFQAVAATPFRDDPTRDDPKP